MKYFLHDTSAFEDERVTRLYMDFGYEGIGLFFTALEKIAKQEKPMNTEVLKVQLKIGKRLEKCFKFMEEIGLLSSTNGETFNENILNFSEKYQIKKEKTRKRVQQWREKQSDTENVTCYVPVSNARKVKESKIKESKEIYIPTIEEFTSYALEKEKLVNKKNVELKYLSWKENDWKDGNDKKITNWKTKLLNTIPYLNSNNSFDKDKPITDVSLKYQRL